MVRSLDKKWKELLFSFSGFGPNLLMVLMGAYFTDAINPAALGSESYQSIMGGVCFIMPAIFPILYMIARIFDGIIDIPFAHLSDTLSTKWGRRRPLIAVSFVPMVASYAMCWWPIGGQEGTLLNTIWISAWMLVFFASYTMCMITFYGSLSSVCTGEAQSLRVSSYKSVFDTISYCLVYALLPIVLEAFKMHIDRLALLLMPLMATIVIPLFLIKEGEKYGYPENAFTKGAKLKIGESIRLTFKNKVFTNWLLVNCCTYFGLQMFLVGMNAMIIGGMGFSGTGMAIVNTCAFAPVPVMLYLFKRLQLKRGIRFAFQTCLLAFAVGIMSFFFGSRFICGDNTTAQYIIGCVGGLFGSWAVGSFFMMPYLASTRISGVEERLTGRNHAAMYFAGNAVATSVVGAVSSLLYENIKMLYFSAETSGIVRASGYEEAASLLGVTEAFNLGVMLVPFIVCVVCIIGAVLALKMPKDFSTAAIAKVFKKADPSLNIDEILLEAENSAQDDEEPIFVKVALCVLSLGVFGFMWTATLTKEIKKSLKANRFILFLLCCLVPFAGSILLIMRETEMKKRGAGAKHTAPVLCVLGLFIPLLPLNIPALAVAQHSANREKRA